MNQLKSRVFYFLLVTAGLAFSGGFLAAALLESPTLESVGIVAGIVTSLVLAIFAFLAAFIQRARYVRELYRPVDFVNHSLAVSRHNPGESPGTFDMVGVSLQAVNPNHEPILMYGENDESWALLTTDDSTDAHEYSVRFINLAVNSNFPERLPSGGTVAFHVWIERDTDCPPIGVGDVVGLRAILKISALPDSLSRFLLPGTRGHYWIPTPIDLEFSFDTSDTPVRIESHNLTFVDKDK